MTTENTVGRDIVTLDARVVRATVRVVAQAGPADLARPTPCADWTLGELLTHMTAQHDGWVAAAAGDGGDLSRWQPGPPAADPVKEYAAAAERVLAAFGADGVLDREFALAELSPLLRFPAAQAISFHFIDYLVHGVGRRALGRPGSTRLRVRARPAGRGAPGRPGRAGR